MIEKIRSFIKENIPLPARIIYVLSGSCVLIHSLFILSESFADFFNRWISSIFRMIFAKLTSVFPFSVAEAFIIFVPITFVVVILWAFRRIKISDRAGNRATFSVVSAIALLYSIFVINFAAGYSASSLESKLDLERKNLSSEDLIFACEYLKDELSSLEGSLNYNFGGASRMPYSNSEMISKLNEAYSSSYEKYTFISRLNAPVKQVMLSELMTYTHISGVYSFFTGEANINVNYPDYILPYTAAHEMAHQRGIAREDEANFVAYLVCMESDDQYIRYSAILNMYEYTASALKKADPEAYKSVFYQLPHSVRSELYSYSDFFDKYRDSTASAVSETINNTYLTVQGTEGTKSYGMVVDLFVAHLYSKS